MLARAHPIVFITLSENTQDNGSRALLEDYCTFLLLDRELEHLLSTFEV